MIAVVLLAMLAAGQVESSQSGALIAAGGTVLVALVGAVAAVYINRNGKVARKVDSNVGNTNGQGTLAQMVARIDTRTTTMDSRAAQREIATAQQLDRLHERLSSHEHVTATRFDSLHELVGKLADRVTHVEDKS